MIKSFECYVKGESVTLGSSYFPAAKWTKNYPNGQTASLYVHNSKSITRALVREAFKALEYGRGQNCFTKADSKRWL